MFHQPFQGFPGEIEPVEPGVPVFEPGQQTERVGVVIESADLSRGCAERIFPGMPERRVSKIVCET